MTWGPKLLWMWLCDDLGFCIGYSDSAICFVDVGHDPSHSADPGGVPLLVGDIIHKKTPPAPAGQDLELTSVGRGHAGSGAQGY